MTEKIAKRLEKIRFQMIKEIAKTALKLNGKVKSEFPDTIPLEFDEDVLRLSGDLRNYPFLKIVGNDSFLVFVDFDCQEEYLKAYQDGTLKMQLEDLYMFSADELFNISVYLDALVRSLN